MLSSLLTILALAYGGIAVLLFLFQDKLAYYPQIHRVLPPDIASPTSPTLIG